MTTRSDTIGTPPEGAITSFVTLLATVEEGQLAKDVTASTEALVRALNDNMLLSRKASGTITIKLKLTADRGMIELTGDYACKMPKETRGRTMLYVANAGFLATRDLRQGALKLRHADGEKPVLRAVTD